MLRKPLLAIAASICVLAGCTHSQPPQPQQQFANWPSDMDGVRIRWSAEPGIDLLTGAAIPVRAYLESWIVGFLSRVPSEKLYPGFERAVPDDIRPDKVETRKKGPFYGTEYFHILALNPVQNGYRAYVCEGRYNVFHPTVSIPGKYVSLDDGAYILADTIRPWRVDLSKRPGNEVTAPQKGTLPAPVQDVFGGWHIDDGTGLEGDEYNRYFPECWRHSMPHTADQRKQIITTLLDSPPKPEPAVPGWPDDSA